MPRFAKVVGKNKPRVVAILYPARGAEPVDGHVVKINPAPDAHHGRPSFRLLTVLSGEDRLMGGLHELLRSRDADRSWKQTHWIAN